MQLIRLGALPRRSLPTILRLLSRTLETASCAALAVCAAFALQTVPPAHAQDAKPAAASADEQAVRAAAAAYRQAAERGDLEAVAKIWTPDADYVDHLGHAFKIQALLGAAQRETPDGGRIARPPLKTDTLAIRFISPDVAVEDGIVERPATAGNTASTGRYCAVWVRRDGKWLIDGVRESPYSPVHSANHFEDLEWLVGDWTGANADVTAEISCTWGPNKKYLLQNTKVTRKGADAITATQWIGWDPIKERVHSFAFDSTGSYVTGDWTQEGEAWIDTNSGVLPDGRRVTSTHIYSRVDDNTALLESVDTMIGDEPRPDQLLQVKRKSAPQ